MITCATIPIGNNPITAPYMRQNVGGLSYAHTVQRKGHPMNWELIAVEATVPLFTILVFTAGVYQGRVLEQRKQARAARRARYIRENYQND
jgi:hypothetical protein